MCKKRSPDGWHRTETKLFVRLCPVCCAIAPKARDDYAEAATNFESCLIAHASRVLACCTATCVDASSSDVDRPRYLEKRFSQLAANRCIRCDSSRSCSIPGTSDLQSWRECSGIHEIVPRSVEWFYLWVRSCVARVVQTGGIPGEVLL